MKLTYIYALKDPRSLKEVRYIGITEDPKGRLKSHVGRAQNTLLKKWLSDLKQDGLRPLMIILDSTKKYHPSELEYKWYSYFKDLGAPLLNLANPRIRKYSAVGSWIPKTQKDLLIELAHQEDKSLSEIVGKAIAEFLNVHEGD